MPPPYHIDASKVSYMQISMYIMDDKEYKHIRKFRRTVNSESLVGLKFENFGTLYQFCQTLTIHQ